MKTIIELSNELNVSKTSIYNFLKKNETYLDEHSIKKQGKTYVDGFLENLMIENYARETLSAIKYIELNTDSKTEESQLNSIVESNLNIVKLVDALEKQLETKDAQINKLHDIIFQKELFTQQQSLIELKKSYINDNKIIENQDENTKKGFFHKFFGKKQKTSV